MALRNPRTKSSLMRIDFKGEIPRLPYDIDGLNDIYIDHKIDCYSRERTVELALGAIHVTMSEIEADALSKRLQVLSGVDQPVSSDKLKIAKQILTPDKPPITSQETACRAWGAVENVIAYLEEQR